MPLSSVNYSGGIIISDWYSAEQNSMKVLKYLLDFLQMKLDQML